MTVKTLSDVDKHGIVYGYVKNKLTQDQLANHYHCSRRTIHRVLIEKGVLPARQLTSKQERTLLEVLQQHGMVDPQQLAQRLTAPALNHYNVQKYLNMQSHDQLASLFYGAAIVKVAEIMDQEQAEEAEV